MSIFSLHGLVSVNLSFNSFNAPISEYFGNTSFLEIVDLSSNSLNSSIPNSLYSLNHLQSLSLGGNYFQGEIASAIGNLSFLIRLYLSDNMLEGRLPTSLEDLCKLNEMYFSHNKIEGDRSEILRSLSRCSLDCLESWNMANNQLSGIRKHVEIPTKLKLGSPFQCETIELAQWYLGPKFLLWLKFQKRLSGLDISHVGISDVIPAWFCSLSTQFEYVNFSSNQISGILPYLNLSAVADLSSNRFIGPLPRVLSTLEALLLSKKSFSGSLVEFVCNSSEQRLMTVLYIDTNFLFGEIPDCWNQWPQLTFLNLGNNNLTGKIPSSLGITSLAVLNLGNNSVFGEIPFALQNCMSLVLLDLSENHFIASVPAWIGDKFSNLVVLRL
ncbi:hypothetical protein V6N13_090605 [Hibiscus sabdariffa]